jgi:HTH-type transcriptional regulator/antitoxin HipB
VRVSTAKELGAYVRGERRTQSLTQAELATRAGVSRDWLIRLEAGERRLEVGLVLDVLNALERPLRTTELPARQPDGADAAFTHRRVDRGDN